MANEIQVSATLTATKNSFTISGSSTGYHDMAGNNLIEATQTIGTSYEALALGDISGAPGYLYVKNMDATNYVELALDTGMTEKFIKLLPGQAAVFPPAVGTIYAKANTAPCLCAVAACEA